jgi:hypothetical protein
MRRIPSAKRQLWHLVFILNIHLHAWLLASRSRYRSSLGCVLKLLPHISLTVPVLLKMSKDGSDELETMIYFEFHSFGCPDKAREAENFIVSIAEPISRQRFMHE